MVELDYPGYLLIPILWHINDLEGCGHDFDRFDLFHELLEHLEFQLVLGFLCILCLRFRNLSDILLSMVGRTVYRIFFLTHGRQCLDVSPLRLRGSYTAS